MDYGPDTPKLLERFKENPTVIIARFLNIHSLPPLPEGIIIIDCDSSQLTVLPRLPSSLYGLYCSETQLTELPPLPERLEELRCGNTRLTVLPRLPGGLKQLKCGKTQLTVLPQLPSSLRELYCDSTQITVLPQLPSSLKELHCDKTQLTVLPLLPEGLQELSCSIIYITSLPPLPNGLTFLRCDHNPNLTTITGPCPVGISNMRAFRVFEGCPNLQTQPEDDELCDEFFTRFPGPRRGPRREPRRNRFNPMEVNPAMEVHNEAAKHSKEFDALKVFLENEIGSDSVNQYLNIDAYLTSTIGKAIKNNPGLKNNRNIRVEYFNRTKKLLSESYLSDERKIHIGRVIDFVFKYNLEECFIPAVLDDTCKAYPLGTPGHANGMSCLGGAYERFFMTLRNCVSTSNSKSNVFNKLRTIFEIPVGSFKNLSLNIQSVYISFFNKKLQKWLEESSTKENYSTMNNSKKDESFIQYLKDTYKSENGSELPSYVIKEYEDRGMLPVKWDYLGGGSRKRLNRKDKTRRRKAPKRKTRKVKVRL